VREIEGITYYNCGDWVESRTAMVEHFDGRIELLEFPPQPREAAQRRFEGAEPAMVGH
jgi:hypothetical protein